jgi:hypothetical protein
MLAGSFRVQGCGNAIFEADAEMGERQRAEM